MFEEINDELQRPERLSTLEKSEKLYLELSKLSKMTLKNHESCEAKPMLSQNLP